MQIYAYYQNDNYADAIAASDRFIQLFPGNPSAAYAFYMKAICNFEQIVDVGRDQGYADAALAGLKDVARRYPGTPYATDAVVKIDMVNDQLAGKEMNIGRYYQRANQPLAADRPLQGRDRQRGLPAHVAHARGPVSPGRGLSARWA